MKLVYRRALPALFAASLAVGIASPALAAGEPPTGTYALNTNAVWAGQSVTLTQSALADDDTEPANISRVISWGDGTAAQTAEAGSTSWTHKYATTGSFTVSVTLNDGTVAGTGTLASATVAVTAPEGTLGWQKNPIYTNTYIGSDNLPHDYSVEGVFTPTGLPADTDEAWVNWPDNEFTLLRKGATAPTAPHYFTKGSFAPKVQLKNKFGEATERAATPLNVVYDKTAPKVAVKYPASPSKASSWTTVRGTASDAHAGVDYVSTLVLKWTDAKGMYIYNFQTKSWLRYTGQELDTLPDGIEDRAKVAANGTWATKPVAGLSKGWHLEIWPVAIDKVANWSNPKYYVPVWLAS
ncbi:hypothetical protein Aab01nite_25820 [Paractinoplanes abujensis]|uniref:5'-nucleotidase n=1 Tax=Paractinoplanes abujensis TaxID=882441 RepID=A0A7W7D093_9ACTN|nr:hypothetical protein [Actinoplanes abujensis]MBB4696543.1 5'-nucleotidase [Actinoplanes abujensis]GID18992.1 hypothetical protein Aab01nite_25820 [Actinoplanes abujensis]